MDAQLYMVYISLLVNFWVLYANFVDLRIHNMIVLFPHDPFCRNERDTAMAHMVKRLTNEGSTFLGEKIIEVRRVGPPQEVWYKLGKSILTPHS